jgi:hypothetical protein
MTLTPVVSAQPPNFGVAETYSYLRVDNDVDRTLYAKAVYLTNISDLNDLLTELINELRQKENDNGFVFVDDTNQYDGNFQTLKVVADCKIAGLTADNSTFGNLSAYELPQGFEINGQIYNFQLAYGAVMAYKTVDINRYTNSVLDAAGHALITIQRGEGIVSIPG